MSSKKITDLNAYSASQVQPYDLLFITDINNQETKKITSTDVVNYVNIISGSGFHSGSFTGSFKGIVSGSLFGTSSWATNSITSSYAYTSSYLNYPNNSTASYAITASYAMNGGSGTGIDLEETISQISHSFSAGQVLYKWAYGVGDSGLFYPASSVYNIATNYSNEAVGIVKTVLDTNSFTIAYNGIVTFVTQPSYFTTATVGTAFYLSGSNGALSTSDPSLTDPNNHVSKPYLVMVDSYKGFILNSRALYTATGSLSNSLSSSYALSSSYSSYALNSLNAVTASYALGGGGGGGTTNITQSTYNYPTNIYQSLPVGSIMAFASASVPLGWLECDGSIVLKSGSYSDLFTAIKNENSSNAFGYSCDGTGVRNPSGLYFKLPDLRGEFVRGWDHSRGVDSGRVFGSLQSGSIAPHRHIDPYAEGGSNYFGIVGSNGGAGSYGGSKSTDGDQGLFVTNDGTPFVGNGSTLNPNPEGTIGTETRPRNIALVYCIRYANLESYGTLTTASYIAGDVIGSLGSTSVQALRGVPITSSAPNNYDVLTYLSGAWINKTVSTLPFTATNSPTTYTVSNPMGSISSGSYQYILQYNSFDAKTRLFRINNNNNQSQYLYTTTGNESNMSIVRSSGSIDYITWQNRSGYVYVLPVGSTTPTPFNTGQSTYPFNTIKIDDITSGSSTYPCFYSFDSNYNSSETLNNLVLRKIRYNGTSWSITTVGTNLDFTNSTYTGNGTFKQFEPMPATRILFFTYNSVKKRLYLMTDGTSFLHIFNISGYSGGIEQWWVDASRYTWLTYEKTITLKGNDAYFSDSTVENYSLEYDLNTGQEYNITTTRRGNSNLNGSVIKLPWFEG